MEVNATMAWSKADLDRLTVRTEETLRLRWMNPEWNDAEALEEYDRGIDTIKWLAELPYLPPATYSTD